MEKIIGLINAPFTPFYENGEVIMNLSRHMQNCL